MIGYNAQKAQEHPGDIVVDFTVQMTKNNLSRHEHHPKLFSYLSAHVLRKEADYNEVPLLDKPVNGQIRGYTSNNEISSNTSLCVALFAWRPDEHSGVNCKVCLGTARLYLREIVEAKPSANRPFVGMMDIQMHTVDNYQKAVVEFRVTRAYIGSASFKMDKFVPPNDELSAYFNKIAAMKESMGESLTGTDRMDAPYDFSESGFALAHLPMPFMAFAMRELPETNAAMWQNSLEIALARDNLRLGDYLNLNNDGKARTLATMVTLIPSYMDYTSDVILKDSRLDPFDKAQRMEGAEIFGANRCTGADCEDTGSMNAELLEAFLLVSFPTMSLADTILRDLQKIGKNYIALRSLDVVRGQQVSDQTGYGAHLNANLISFAQFRYGLEHGSSEGKTVAAQLPWPSDMNTETDAWPLMVAEGTGIYEPLGYDENLQHAKSVVYNLRSLANLKKPIVHGRSQATPFFVASLIGTTGYFARRGSRYGTFFYTNGSAQKRGALYSDIAADAKDKFGFIAMPPVSKAIMNAIYESSALAIPPTPLLLDRKTVDAAKQNAHLDRVVKAVADQRRPVPSSAEHVAVPVYIRPYQLSDDIVTGMIRDFTRTDAIYKVSYHLERITNQIYGYRMMVHVSI